MLGLVLLLAGWCWLDCFLPDPLWVNDQQIRFHLWRAGVQSEYVEVGGYRLHYFEASPPDGSGGTPLVLVHGLGARRRGLGGDDSGAGGAGFHVYAPDLLGYGRSPRPDVSLFDLAGGGDVVDFIQAVSYSGPTSAAGRWADGSR